MKVYKFYDVMNGGALYAITTSKKLAKRFNEDRNVDCGNGTRFTYTIDKESDEEANATMASYISNHIVVKNILTEDFKMIHNKPVVTTKRIDMVMTQEEYDTISNQSNAINVYMNDIISLNDVYDSFKDKTKEALKTLKFKEVFDYVYNCGVPWVDDENDNVKIDELKLMIMITEGFI